MIENGRSDELKLLYKCFSREESNLSRVIHCLNDYIEQHGGKIISDEALLKEPCEFTQKLLDFKHDVDTLISYAFNNNIKFEKGRDNSFQNFMNASPSTPSYIANYSDRELKQGIQGLSNEEVDQRLSAIVRLFCCLHGRDIYIKAYQSYLATRLLNKTMISQEAEELMLSKLKMELGINAVNKMTQMFKDMKFSKEMHSDFDKNANNRVNGVEMSTIQVLTNGNWPIDEPTPCIIPPVMKELTVKFERFYNSKFNNRKLMWLSQFGTVEMSPLFTTRKGYQLIVNVFQATVLNLFNEKDSYTYQELSEKTQVPKARLDAGLIMMCKP